MANNRLYIEDTETGEKFLLCKSFGNWQTPAMFTEEALNYWLRKRDIAACTSNLPTNLRLVTENETYQTALSDGELT